MITLIPFSIKNIFQIATVSVLVSVFNIGINTIVSTNKKYLDLKKVFNESVNGNRVIPKDIEKYNINTYVYLNFFYWTSIVSIVGYIFISLVATFYPDFYNIVSISFQDKQFIVSMSNSNLSQVIYTDLIDKVVLIVGISFTWIELIIIILVFFCFFKIMYKYINIIKK